MPDVDIVPQTVGRATGGLGLNATALVLADEFVIPNDGRTFLVFNNSQAGDVDVTIATPQTVDGLAVADRVESVAQGDTKPMGPWPIATYGEELRITAGTDAVITVAAFQIG